MNIRPALTLSSFTLDHILGLCDEVGDCLLWGGYMGNGSPQRSVLDDTVDPPVMRCVQVRRLAWKLYTGQDVPAGRVMTIICGDPRCLSRDHIRPRTVQQVCQRAAAAGRFSTPQRKAAITAGRRKSAPKLTIEAAREIRSSDETNKTLAERYGVALSHIARIRRNEAWREHTAGASVFSL